MTMLRSVMMTFLTSPSLNDVSLTMRSTNHFEENFSGAFGTAL